MLSACATATSTSGTSPPTASCSTCARRNRRSTSSESSARYLTTTRSTPPSWSRRWSATWTCWAASSAPRKLSTCIPPPCDTASPVSRNWPACSSTTASTGSPSAWRCGCTGSTSPGRKKGAGPWKTEAIMATSYASYQYLVAGEDYQAFGLAAELDRVPSTAPALDARQEAIARRLLHESVVISLHDHPTVRPSSPDDFVSYRQQGRDVTGYAGIAASGVDVFFDGLMAGVAF